VGKPRTKWEDVVRRDITNPRNTRMEETSRRQRRREASSESRPGPRRGCSAVDGWMDGWMNE